MPILKAADVLSERSDILLNGVGQVFESVGNLDECFIGGSVFGVLKVTSCFGIAHHDPRHI